MHFSFPINLEVVEFLKRVPTLVWCLFHCNRCICFENNFIFVYYVTSFVVKAAFFGLHWLN